MWKTIPKLKEDGSEVSPDTQQMAQNDRVSIAMLLVPAKLNFFTALSKPPTAQVQVTAQLDLLPPNAGHVLRAFKKSLLKHAETSKVDTKWTLCMKIMAEHFAANFGPRYFFLAMQTNQRLRPDRATATVATVPTVTSTPTSERHGASQPNQPSQLPGKQGKGKAGIKPRFIEPGHRLQLGDENRQNWQLQLHNSGQCFPCIAFALKPAGCFKGDECRHCHFCNAEQAKARRRQLQQAARRQKRRRGHGCHSQHVWLILVQKP